MRTYTKIEIEPFEPHPMMRNAHLQTAVGNTARQKSGIHFRRERIDTPDGDFLDLDFADVENATWEQLGDDTPIVMMLHGLEGNARSGPAHEIYRYLSRRGVRCLGMNMRSCSGEMNRTARLYHAGETEDLGFVHNWLLKRFPNTPIGFVAISLGANILLKYLGEQGSALHNKLVAAVAISPPFDLLTGADVLESRMGKLYTQQMLNPLKLKAKAMSPLIQHKVDLTGLDEMTTFRQFDNQINAPLHGFANATEYYIRTSSKHFLPYIEVPTLILRAIDDPFFDPNDIPYEVIESNPNLYGGFPEHGGHVGFIEGVIPGQYTYWAERQSARFLALVV